MLVIGECLFEPRARQPVTDAAREFAQIQPLARRINRPKQALQPALQILRSYQERLGVLFARFDQANCGVRRQGREEGCFRRRRIKFESAVEFQHASRIQRSRFGLMTMEFWDNQTGDSNDTKHRS